MLLRFVFFLCFPICFLTSAINNNIIETPIPFWVKACDFSLGPVEVKPSQVNVQCLLIDTQRNWERKTVFNHFAIKVLNQAGAELVSQLHIDFESSYNKAVMHVIRIYRDGKWFDRLKNSRLSLIQREKDLDKNLYNGDLTAIYFINDIREGDIIEYAYSIIGHHPLFDSYYTDFLSLQRSSSIEKISHRFFSHPDHSFLVKPFNTPIGPKIIDHSPSLREWFWEATATMPYLNEPNEPSWYNSCAYIQMSQYSTWKEVADLITSLYSLPAKFKAPSEMLSLVKDWENSAQDVTEKALLALRYVQDEVGYQGFEEGMGAFKPNDPCAVFQRRFGDCKDKAFLLHTLLKLMNIQSVPCLVNTTEGQRVYESLPTPFVFNHVILKILINGSAYWVDPTLSHQGNTLQNNFFPDYQWGLLLAKDTISLVRLPSLTIEKPTEIETSFLLTSIDSANVKITTTYYDSMADQMRLLVDCNGLKKFSDDFISDMQRVYGHIDVLTPLSVTDDREKNVFSFTESYSVPTKEVTDKKTISILSCTIHTFLEGRINPERSSPYALTYPRWVKEHIHIENPHYQWELATQDICHQHESLLFSFLGKMEGQTADFHYELKHLKDHVPTSSLVDYWNITNDIERYASYEPIISGPQKNSSKMLHGLISSGIWIAVGIFFTLRGLKKRRLKKLLGK